MVTYSTPDYRFSCSRPWHDSLLVYGSAIFKQNRLVTFQGPGWFKNHPPPIRSKISAKIFLNFKDTNTPI